VIISANLAWDLCKKIRICIGAWLFGNWYLRLFGFGSVFSTLEYQVRWSIFQSQEVWFVTLLDPNQFGVCKTDTAITWYLKLDTCPFGARAPRFIMRHRVVYYSWKIRDSTITFDLVFKINWFASLEVTVHVSISATEPHWNFDNLREVQILLQHLLDHSIYRRSALSTNLVIDSQSVLQTQTYLIYLILSYVCNVWVEGNRMVFEMQKWKWPHQGYAESKQQNVISALT